MSKLVFHDGKLNDWTLISKFSSSPYSLAYFVSSSMCLFAGLSGFLVMLVAYNVDFKYFSAWGMFNYQISDAFDGT